MFIPLTHEQSTVRSLPWVSLAILGLCLVIFAYLRTAHDEIEASAGAYGDALSYFVTHPYLEPDPRLVAAGGVEQVRRAVGGRPAPGAVTALDQRELDRRTETWLVSLETNPLWTLGMIPTDVRPLGAVAHIFTHAGWLHLLGNLLFFYLMAPFVEDRFGHGVFTAFFLAAGVLAGLVHCAHYPDLSVPLIGASGAISATMGAFLVLFGRTRIKILTFIFFVPKTFLAPAWVVLPLWFLTDLAMAVEGSRSDPSGLLTGTAYWAHVGGFGVGLVVAFVFLLVAKPRSDDDLGPATLDVMPAVVARARRRTSRAAARRHGGCCARRRSAARTAMR